MLPPKMVGVVGSGASRWALADQYQNGQGGYSSDIQLRGHCYPISCIPSIIRDLGNMDGISKFELMNIRQMYIVSFVKIEEADTPIIRQYV